MIGNLIHNGKIKPAQVKAASSKSYTLVELEVLAKQWRDENKVAENTRWEVSYLLAWLKKREREVGDGA